MNKSDMTHEEWLAWRRQGICGTDVWDLLEGCQRRLWYDKTGVPPDYPIEQTPRMAWGSELQPIVAKKVGKRLKSTVRLQDSCIQHPDHPWLRGDLDGALFAWRAVLAWAILEIKTVSDAEARRIKRDATNNSGRASIRERWLLQTHTYIEIAWAMHLGADKGVLAIFNRDTGELDIVEVPRHPHIGEAIIARGEALWRQIENGPQPDRVGPDRDDCCRNCPWRRTCLEPQRLEQMEIMDPGPYAELPVRDELAQPMRDYAEAAAMRKQWAEIEDAAKGRIIELAGQREARCDAGYLRHVPGGKRLDTALVKSQHKDVYDACLKVAGDSWRVYAKERE